MPANLQPKIDYVICPDGTTAVGDNCGSTLPLYQQEEIALANIKSNPIFIAAINAGESYPPKMLKETQDVSQPETILGNGLTNGQKWAWVIGLTLAAWGLIYWSEKQSNK